MIGIQMMLLIPCYTETDAEKARKIMLNLIDQYTRVIFTTKEQLSGLAQHETFMSELEDIATKNTAATTHVMNWCRDYAASFELHHAMFCSLYALDTKTKYQIEAKIDGDGNLDLELQQNFLPGSNPLKPLYGKVNKNMPIDRAQVKKNREELENQLKKAMDNLETLKAHRSQLETQLKEINAERETQAFINLSAKKKAASLYSETRQGELEEELAGELAGQIEMKDKEVNQLKVQLAERVQQLQRQQSRSVSLQPADGAAAEDPTLSL